MSSSSMSSFWGKALMSVQNPEDTRIDIALGNCGPKFCKQMKPGDLIRTELFTQYGVQVQSHLSQGGFSETFNVAVNGRESPYCMKVSKKAEDKECYKTLFQEEINNLQTLWALDSLHTVRLHNSFTYAFGKGVNRTILIEQYGGETIRKKYSKDESVPQVPVSHIGHIAAQMLIFLRVLENAGKVLGDISTSNIVIGGDPKVPGSLKFIDLAELYEEGESISKCYRTTRWYRSPTVLLQKAHRSEMFFSIGCILFEIFTGEALFNTNERIRELPPKAAQDDYQHLGVHFDAVNKIVPMTPAFKEQVPLAVKNKIFLNDLPEDLRLKQESREAPISLIDRVIKGLEAKPDRLVYDSTPDQNLVLNTFVELLHRLLDYHHPSSAEEMMQMPFFTKVVHQELDVHLKAQSVFEENLLLSDH